MLSLFCSNIIQTIHFKRQLNLMEISEERLFSLPYVAPKIMVRSAKLGKR